MFSFSNANIRLLLVDITDFLPENSAQGFSESNPSLQFLREKLLSLTENDSDQTLGSNTIIVLNKTDAVDPRLKIEAQIQQYFDKRGFKVCKISCKDGTGVDELLNQITSSVKNLLRRSSSSV